MEQLQELLTRKQEIENLIKNKQENLAHLRGDAFSGYSLNTSYDEFKINSYYDRIHESGMLELLEYQLEKINADIEKFYYQ
ncbi:MAG: hypothetical protein LBK69_05630 [Syntrophomonadaceae bacterium]|jgi:hypothetical protein|nr:hypothetical protein [Syntrophomonadaceae bacterium]